MPDDNASVRERDGEAARKMVVGVVGSLLVLAVSGVFGLWSGFVQLRTEFDSFRGIGERCTGTQCAELARRILANEVRLEKLREDYTGHKAWGQQWTVETARRLDSLERKDRSVQFFQDKR